MSKRVHLHGDACGCAAHRPVTASTSSSGPWPALLAFLACAACPACLTLYAKLFSVFALGVSVSELHHVILLVVAIGASLGVSAWRSWRTRRLWPTAVAALGSALIAVGHLADELHAVEWAGVLVLLAGGFAEHLRLRSSSPGGALAVQCHEQQ